MVIVFHHVSRLLICAPTPYNKKTSPKPEHSDTCTMEVRSALRGQLGNRIPDNRILRPQVDKEKDYYRQLDTKHFNNK